MRKTIITTLLLLLALPAAAGASSSQESLFQDDNTLLSADASRRDRSLDELKALGVDVIRSNVSWSAVAPHAHDYSNWDRWDALVQGAQSRGIEVQLTLTGPMPSWASDCGRTCRPNPAEYGRFAAAAAKHFPTVRRWSIWNEPNQSGWLYPQYSRYHGAYRPEAPYRYRRLAYAAIEALNANGHRGDRILLGETAPLGRRSGSWPRRSMSPVAFLRGVFCLDSHGRALRGWDARALHCHATMPKLEVNGYAHHPYTRGGGADPLGKVGGDDITLGTIGRLGRELDRAAHLRRIPSGLGIWLTEYGFQTDPPDRYVGVRPSQAAEWLNESDWIAYNARRIRSVAQYELFDERDTGAFQTGLRYESGKPKPGYDAYRVPLWVAERHGASTVWGQVRPGTRGEQVQVKYQPKRGRGWRVLGTLTVANSCGFVKLRTHTAAYRWRLYWRDATGRLRGASRAARPGSR